MTEGDRVICKGFTAAYEGLHGRVSRMKGKDALVHFDKGFSTTIPVNYLWETVQQARVMPGWTHTTASGEQKVTGRGKETP